MSEPIEVHVTEVDWFYECAYRWSRQKVIGDWGETNSRPFMRGRAVHHAREVALTNFAGAVPEGEDPLCEKGHWPSFEELKRAGMARLEMDLGGDHAPFDDKTGDYCWIEPDTGEVVPFSELMEEIEPYIEFDRNNILPRFEKADIVAVEERWYLPIQSEALKNDYVLTGKLDLLVREPVSGRLVNHDLKTGARITQKDADLSPQLSGYSAGIQAKYDELPLHALGSPRFLVGPPRNTGPGAVVEQLENGMWGVYETVSTDRGPDDILAYLKRLAMFLEMREHEWFPPAKGGFMSPCARCPHAFADGEERCDYSPVRR